MKFIKKNYLKGVCLDAFFSYMLKFSAFHRFFSFSFVLYYIYVIYLLYQNNK